LSAALTGKILIKIKKESAKKGVKLSKEIVCILDSSPLHFSQLGTEEYRTDSSLLQTVD
jgi:hypothetical protein